MQINLSIFRTCKEVFPVVLINKFIYVFCYFSMFFKIVK